MDSALESSGLSQYELLREANIRRNRAMMIDLGLEETVADARPSSRRRVLLKSASTRSTGPAHRPPPRRSGRRTRSVARYTETVPLEQPRGARVPVAGSVQPSGGGAGSCSLKQRLDRFRLVEHRLLWTSKTKRSGSRSAQRLESYRRATTVNDLYDVYGRMRARFVDCHGNSVEEHVFRSADLVYDFTHGYVSVQRTLSGVETFFGLTEWTAENRGLRATGADAVGSGAPPATLSSLAALCLRDDPFASPVASMEASVVPVRLLVRVMPDPTHPRLPSLPRRAYHGRSLRLQR